jgi:hypothetical protein
LEWESSPDGDRHEQLHNKLPHEFLLRVIKEHDSDADKKSGFDVCKNHEHADANEKADFTGSKYEWNQGL